MPVDLTTLLGAASGSPLLLAGLVVLGAVSFAAEKMLALSGPITSLLRWWRGRELAKLRREAIIRAEKRRLEQEEESAVIADLRRQIAALSAEVARLRLDTAPMRASRNPPRVPELRR